MGGGGGASSGPPALGGGNRVREEEVCREGLRRCHSTEKRWGHGGGGAVWLLEVAWGREGRFSEPPAARGQALDAGPQVAGAWEAKAV